MTRLERLLSIALVLSARRRLRAQELAEEFGVTLRTVYRDVRALQQAGFPVVGTAGDGYRIPAASQLRPLAFKPEEAEVLVMAARLLEALVDAPLKDRLRSAVSKLEAILPPAAIQRVQEQRDRVVIEPRYRSTGPLATQAVGMVNDHTTDCSRYHVTSRKMSNLQRRVHEQPGHRQRRSQATR